MTLTEIQDNYAKENNYDNWLHLLNTCMLLNHHLNKVFELVQQEQQKLIAENAKVKYSLDEELDKYYSVDKSSIINENNIIR